MEFSPFQRSQDVAGTARAEDYSSFGESTFAIEKQRIKDDLWWEQMKQMLDNLAQQGIEEAEDQWGQSDFLATTVDTLVNAISSIIVVDGKKIYLNSLSDINLLTI